MISKRNYRRQSPIESLRQFSLNSSKGVDCSRPVTDPNTLYDIDNLSINTDGSLSLRKPIALCEDVPLSVSKDAIRIVQSHDPDLRVVFFKTESGYPSLKIYQISKKDFVTFSVHYTYYYNSATYAQYSTVLLDNNTTAITGTVYYTLAFDLTKSNVTALGTSTIVSDVQVSKGEQSSGFAPDKNYVYRYLQIYSENSGIIVKVVNPERNVLSEADGEIALDANLLLDNPYALRDEYFKASPRCRGIFYYAPSVRYGDHVQRANVATRAKALEHMSDMFKFTESSETTQYRPVNTVSFVGDCDILRAFTDISRYNVEGVYAAWFGTNDGETWECLTPALEGAITVREADGSDFGSKKEFKYVPLSYGDANPVFTSPFVATAEGGTEVVPNTPVAIWASAYATFAFRIVTVKYEEVSEGTEGTEETTLPTVGLELDRALLTVPVGDTDEFVYSDMPNGSRGKKIYRNSTLYTYGLPELKCNLLTTFPGEFTTPMSGVISASDAAGEYITTLIPWREYLISATQSNINLHGSSDGGWYSKIINASMGIPEADSRCCVAVLNGTMFKAGSKIYQLYPNIYSGTDTILNVTELSKPVEELLLRYSGDGSQFAFSTESEYILMLPDKYEEVTYCLRYDYTYKRWTHCTYPIAFYDYRINTIEDIRLYGHQKVYHVEYYFDKTPQAVDYVTPYCDVLFALDSKGAPTTVNTPIKFLYDTGQKTDNLINTKQFVETKMVFATLNEEDSFPFTLHVAVDGDPHVTRKDVHTDAPFWKSGDNTSRGVAGTVFRLTTDSESPAAGTFNTLRQLVVRYSGRGKSVRHVIEGSSLYNFKLYETYVRYKLPNVKQ